MLFNKYLVFLRHSRGGFRKHKMCFLFPQRRTLSLYETICTSVLCSMLSSALYSDHLKCVSELKRVCVCVCIGVCDVQRVLCE